MKNLAENMKDLLDDSGSLPVYAWPGGYPLFYFDEQNNVLCPACANQNDEYTAPIFAHGVNYEDDNLYCDHCGNQIKSNQPMEKTMEKTKKRILSIDAWGNNEDGYDWNAWYTAGTIDKADFEQLKTDKQIATWFRMNGYTNTDDMRRIVIDDDGYNVVLIEKKSGCPLFAIEYGPEY